MGFKKNDFIEIEFTGKTKEGVIFDSNVEEDLKKANLNIKAKPFIFSLGQGMFLKGVDDFLIGKEKGEYTIELNPENAFGKRDSSSVQIIPMKVFKEQQVQPFPGAIFNFDGKMGKVLTVSGGRTIVDFNHPLAGKEVIYGVKVLRKIEDIKEKVKALNTFLFKKDLKFEIKDKKLIIEAEKGMVQFIGLFKDKFKEILGLDLEIKEEELKENKKIKEDIIDNQKKVE